jgi:hypothetical protein
MERKSKLELLPVVTEPQATQGNTVRLGDFLKPGGRRLALDKPAVQKVQQYMLAHNTEALSEDGVVAFTVHGDGLAECDFEAYSQAAGVQEA